MTNCVHHAASSIPSIVLVPVLCRRSEPFICIGSVRIQTITHYTDSLAFAALYILVVVVEVVRFGSNMYNTYVNYAITYATLHTSNTMTYDLYITVII